MSDAGTLARVSIDDDLAAETEEFEALLGRLGEGDWARPSACAGWTVADVVLHLAQCEEAVVDVYKRQISTRRSP